MRMRHAEHARTYLASCQGRFYIDLFLGHDWQPHVISKTVSVNQTCEILSFPYLQYMYKLPCNRHPKPRRLRVLLSAHALLCLLTSPLAFFLSPWLPAAGAALTRIHPAKPGHCMPELAELWCPKSSCD